MITGDVRWRPCMLGADLWQRVFEPVPRPGTRICKVAAHVHADQAEERAALGNDAADKAASAAHLVLDAFFLGSVG